MPSVPRSLPKRLHRKHGSYYYVSRVNGKVRWLKLAKDYGEALRKWAELEGGRPSIEWTVETAIAHYLKVSANRLKDATLESYTAAAKQILPVLGSIAIDALTKNQVYTYVVKRGNVAANRERALLSATYTHLTMAGVFNGPNPAAGLQFRNPEKARRRYVTDAELTRLMDAARGRMKLVVRFAYLTGIRQADIIGMRLTSATEAGIAYVDGKTGKDHLIAWTDELRSIWKAARGARIGDAVLFLTQDGTQYTSDGFKASWRHVKLRAKLKDVRFHDLRRKTGSDADDDTHAQELLGHSDAKVTKRHYRAKTIAVKPLDPLSVRQKPER